MDFYDKYDLETYLNIVENMEESQREPYINAYNKYLKSLSIKEKGYSYKEAETKIFGLKKYSDTNIIYSTLNDYYSSLSTSKDNLDKMEELIKEIAKITDTPMSNTTKIKLIKYKIAEFGINNELDCYLFDANDAVFEDYYNKIILSKGKGR